MRLVTIQPVEVLKDLSVKHRYVCDTEKVESYEDADLFTDAYAWMNERLAERIGAAPVGVTYPIWAWYRYDGDFAHWNGGGTFVKIVLDIDPERVVLSDFDDWNCILNGGPVVTDEDEDDVFEEENIRKTWERVFHDDGECVQACFWELRSDDVLSVEVFTSTKYEEESE